MPLYTDMIMDNFEDYANHHEDDGVIKLQNMPEDASMEQWGAKLQEIADEFICAPRYFLMCWLASYCLDKDLLDDLHQRVPCFYIPERRWPEEIRVSAGFEGICPEPERG